MTVRFRLALTVFLTGLATALGVIVTVAIAFQRFDSEGAWHRSDAFLGRVVAQHPDLLEQQQRNPEGLTAFLRNLLLYEPDSQLYLLGADGTVLASTGNVRLAPGFKVRLAPVQEAAALAASGNSRRATYVMGDDPEYMKADAVVAARALRSATVAAGAAAQGYLYFVCHKPWLPANQLDLIGSSLASPAIASTLAVVLLGTALAAWIIVAVTRPLRVLSQEVALAARDGFEAAPAALAAPAGVVDDEFGRLRRGFHALLSTLRQQWDELKRLDHFRRESVSNLSHDLRSPLTATVACLETLEQRWRGEQGRFDERHLVEVALRNTRNAAAMVRALGDLALLDEPTFRLRRTRLDLGEVLDDIVLRFAPRAAALGVALRFRQLGAERPVAEVDVELFERAVANVLDNAFKFTAPGGAVEITALRRGAEVQLAVIDDGTGIGAADLPHLFDRHYQSRTSVAPASSEEGRGLGLAIVKRIVELHGGSVAVQSRPGSGTRVTLTLPHQPAA